MKRNMVCGAAFCIPLLMFIGRAQALVDCCFEDFLMNPGCDDSHCQDSVCAGLPHCCSQNHYWDDKCAEKAHFDENCYCAEDIQVNTYTNGDQQHPDVAMDRQGHFVVVWESPDQPGGDIVDIYAQLFRRNGTPRGSEFRVNTYITSTQTSPSVAMSPSGDFVVAWQSFGQDTCSNGVFLKLFNRFGAALTGDIQANTYTTENQTSPSVDMEDNGEFVVVWESYHQDFDRSGVFGQRFDSDGSFLGSEFPVNTWTANNQYEPAIGISHGEGNFLVSWTSAEQDTSGLGVFAQPMEDLGFKVGPELMVPTAITSDQRCSSVAMDKTTNGIIVWQSDLHDGSERGIFGQFYSNGIPQGGNFLVNVHTDLSQLAPDVDLNADGLSLVAWQSMDQTYGELNIFARRFDRSGNAIDSPEFQVNSFDENYQDNAAVAINPDGRFVVVWQSDNQVSPTSEYDIYAQVYDENGDPL